MTLTPEQDKFAKEIATILREPNTELIARVLAVAGPKRTGKFLQKAVQLYRAGFKTEDGQRQRTPGGCFFYAAKRRMTKGERRRAGLLFAIEQTTAQDVES